jgi:hypothetical protein
VIGLIEIGKADPGPVLLRDMARVAGLSLADARRLLDESQRLARLRREREGGEVDLMSALPERLRDHLSGAVRRLWALPRPVPLPIAGDRQKAQEQWELLKLVPSEMRPVVVRADEELQNWALCEAVCQESTRQASRTLKDAADLAGLAEEIAGLVRGPEGFCRRLLGYAAAHPPNVQRVAGELKPARAALEKAKVLWHSGSDPFGLLDPGRLLDLEASLCRDERNFAEAVTLLDQALTVSHSPGHVLVNKGFTLEVMRSVEALLQAIPLIDRQAEPRLWNIAHLNLANDYVHLARYGDAVELMDAVRPRVIESGDQIDLIRIVWLEGRLAAGLGQPLEARLHLARARREFTARAMWYDVSLALLEEAIAFLDEGRTAEVKELAADLQVVFDANGAHREALASLRLFAEAAKSEAATAEYGRKLLRHLFRARHDEGLKLEEA